MLLLSIFKLCILIHIAVCAGKYNRSDHTHHHHHVSAYIYSLYRSCRAGNNQTHRHRIPLNETMGKEREDGKKRVKWSRHYLYREKNHTLFVKIIIYVVYIDDDRSPTTHNEMAISSLYRGRWIKRSLFGIYVLNATSTYLHGYMRTISYRPRIYTTTQRTHFERLCERGAPFMS